MVVNRNLKTAAIKIPRFIDNPIFQLLEFHTFFKKNQTKFEHPTAKFRLYYNIKMTTLKLKQTNCNHN